MTKWGSKLPVGRPQGVPAQPEPAAKPPSPPQAGYPAGAPTGGLRKNDKKEEDSRYAV